MRDLPEETSTRALSAYRPRPDGVFDSTELTRGPWDAGHQHAGPPIALATRALAAAGYAVAEAGRAVELSVPDVQAQLA